MSVLELISRFRTVTHSRALLSRSWASPNPHSCELMKVNFQRSHLIRQFSAFRNFDLALYVMLSHYLLTKFVWFVKNLKFILK